MELIPELADLLAKSMNRTGLFSVTPEQLIAQMALPRENRDAVGMFVTNHLVEQGVIEPND